MPEDIDLPRLFDAVRNCDLRQVLEARGHQFQRDNKFRENPIREERTPSIHVRADAPSRWHDFGSDEGGDLIDFLQAAEGLDQDAARREAAQLLGVNGAGASHKSDTAKRGRGSEARTRPEDAQRARTREATKTARDYTRLVDEAHDALLHSTSKEAHEARAYLEHRGLKIHEDAAVPVLQARLGVIDDKVAIPEGLSRQQLRGRLVFPYYGPGGKPTFFNARTAYDPHDSQKRFRKPAGSETPGPFNLQAVTADTDFAILVEGELDALAVMLALGPDAPVLASGGGSFSKEMLKPLAGQVTDALLLLDADERGRQHAEKTREALRDLEIRAAPLELPAGASDPNEALTQLGAEALRAHLRPQVDEARRINDAAYITTRFLEELQRRHQRPHPAYPTGLAPIDQLLDGGYHEGLHILGGITGGGKTSFALRLALENALAGRHVLYASFEQSKHELWSRLAAAVTPLPYGALKRGTYHERDGSALPAGELLQKHDDFATLQRASEKLLVLEAGDALSRHDSEHTLEGLKTTAARLGREGGAPPLVVIDYLQRVPVPGLSGREIRERVAYVAGLLQVSFARDLGCPVLALSSLGRASYSNGQKASIEQRLSSLKESGDIEYSAYTVALLAGYPEGAEPSGLAPGSVNKWKPVSFDLAKNREGRTGEATLLWTPPGDSWEAHRERRPSW